MNLPILAIMIVLAASPSHAAEAISENQLHITLGEYCEKNKKDYLITQSNTCKVAREKKSIFDLCRGDSTNDSKSKMFLDELAMNFARATGREESEIRPLICGKWAADNQAVNKPTCDAEAKGTKTITRKWWNGQDWVPTTETATEVKASADKGDAHSLFNLGHWYESGADCFPRDQAKAVQFYCLAYDKKFPMAAVQLQGIAKNNGVPADKARDLLGRRFGCALTAEQAQYDAETKKQEEKAKLLLEKAESGDVAAMTKVAAYYQSDSEGLKQDDKKAFYWAEQAAKKGSSEAMGLLGSFFNRGVGTEKNDNEAFKWFLKAARGGDVDSMAFVGDCYRLGQGTETNVTEAVKWLSRAMDAGDANAKESLIEMYQRGELHSAAFQSLSKRLKNLEERAKKQ